MKQRLHLLSGTGLQPLLELPFLARYPPLFACIVLTEPYRISHLAPDGSELYSIHNDESGHSHLKQSNQEGVRMPVTYIHSLSSIRTLYGGMYMERMELGGRAIRTSLNIGIGLNIEEKGQYLTLKLSRAVSNLPQSSVMRTVINDRETKGQVHLKVGTHLYPMVQTVI